MRWSGFNRQCFLLMEKSKQVSKLYSMEKLVVLKMSTARIIMFTTNLLCRCLQQSVPRQSSVNLLRYHRIMLMLENDVVL